MTRLVTCGWEANDLSELRGASNLNGVSESIVSTSPTPRSPGTYCYKLQGPGVSSGIGVRTIPLAAPVTDVWVRFGLYMGGWTGGAPSFLQFADSTGAVQGTVDWNSTDLLVRVRSGNVGTLLGTSSLAMSGNTWHTFEARWQISSATVGTVEIWVDGTRWINLTGIDNTNTSTLNIQNIVLGHNVNFGWSSGNVMAFDDLAINDTNGSINNAQIGDGRVVLLKPNGAGSNTNQSRGGTDSGANFSQCNELPPSIAQYVFSSTPGTRDTYALENIPAGVWIVNSVEVLALAQNSDTGLGQLGLTVVSGATTNEGTAQILTISPTYYRQLYEVDPNTGTAWTNAAVNALEAGTTVR